MVGSLLLILIGIFLGVAISAYTTTDERMYAWNEKRKKKNFKAMQESMKEGE